MTNTIEIKIDVIDYKQQIQNVTNAWSAAAADGKAAPDPGIDVELLYREALKLTKVKVGEVAVKGGPFADAVDLLELKNAANSTPAGVSQPHNCDPSHPDYVGGYGAGNDPDPEVDTDGKLVVKSVGVWYTVEADQAKITEENIKKDPAIAPIVSDAQKPWMDKADGTIELLNIDGENYWACIVRTSAKVGSDWVQKKLNAWSSLGKIEGGGVSLDSGRKWYRNKDMSGDPVPNTQDPRVPALHRFIKHWTIDMAQIEKKDWYEEEATLGTLKELGENQLESDLGANLKQIDLFANWLIINMETFPIRTEFGLDWGTKNYIAIPSAERVWRILVHDNVKTELKKDTAKLGAHLATQKETTQKEPIVFWSGGIARRFGLAPSGLARDLNVVASILEAYQKEIKKSKTMTTPVDLAIYADKLRDFPSAFQTLLEQQKGYKGVAPNLNDDLKDQFQIQIDKNWKIVAISNKRVGKGVSSTDEGVLVTGDAVKAEYFEVGIPPVGVVLGDSTVLHYLHQSAKILDKIGSPEGVKLYHWSDFLKDFHYPFPEIKPVGGPVTEVLDDIINFGLPPGGLNDVFADPDGRISGKLLHNINRQADATYNLIGERIFGGQILSKRMTRIQSVEDMFGQMLHKVSIAELIGIAFKCLAKYTDLAGYLDAGCGYAIETLGLEKAEKELLPMLEKKDPQTAAFLRQKLDDMKAMLVGAQSGQWISAATDNKVVATVDKADATGFMKEAGSKDVKAQLDKGLKNILSGLETSSPERVAICAALILLIPAIWQLIKEDIDEEKLWRSMKKRLRVFIMADFPIIDFLGAIGDMVVQIMLNVVRDILMSLIERIIGKIDQYCSESADSDLINSDPEDSPYNQGNINDIIRENASPEEFAKAIADVTAELGSTENVITFVDFTDFFDDLSEKLSVSELCSLMGGQVSQALRSRIELLVQESHPNLLPLLKRRILFEKIFKSISAVVDPSACRRLVEEHEERKRLYSECCINPDPYAAKEKHLADQIGPDEAKKAIDREKIENTVFIKDMIPWIADPKYLENLLPPLFCGPDAPNGIVKLQQPSMAYSFDKMLRGLFEEVENTFNKDVKKYKKMIMSSSTPWKDANATDPDAGHQTFGDSVSTWLDMLVSMILPFGDDPEPSSTQAKNMAFKMNTAAGIVSPEGNLLVAKELRQQLDPEDMNLKFHKGDYVEGFEISFKAKAKKITYYENRSTEPKVIPLLDPNDLDELGVPQMITLDPGEYRTDVVYIDPNYNDALFTKIATTGELEQSETTAAEDLKKMVQEGPLKSIFSDQTSSDKFFNTVLATSEFDDLYEAVIIQVYKRFLEKTKDSGFFQRNIFKRLKLESGSPPLSPIVAKDGQCQPYSEQVGANPDFMNAGTFVAKVKERREELQCKVEDPEAQAMQEAVVEMIARLQTIQVFLKLLFAASLFDFENVFNSQVVQEMIATELGEDMLKTGSQRQNISTQERISRTAQRIAIGIIDSKEDSALKDAQIVQVMKDNKMKYNSALDIVESGEGPKIENVSLKDPLTGEEIEVRTGSQALLFLAKEEMPEIKELYKEKMKHLLPQDNVFDRSDPKRFFSRIAYSDFVEMPFGVNNAGPTLLDGGIPRRLIETAPKKGHPVYPRFQRIREKGFDGGLFFERYVEIVPRELPEGTKDQLKKLIEVADPDTKSTLEWMLGGFAHNQFPDANYSHRGKINLDRAKVHFPRMKRISVNQSGFEGLSESDPKFTKPAGNTGIDINLQIYKTLINLPYTTYFEPIKFGVRLSLVVSENSDVNFKKIEEEYNNYLDSIIAEDDGFATMLKAQKIRDKILEEKVLMLEQVHTGGERFLVLPLIDESESPFAPSTKFIDVVGEDTADNHLLLDSVDYFKVKTTTGATDQRTSGDMRDAIENSPEGKAIIDGVFKMDRFFSAMTANHIVAFDVAYPQIVDIFNATKAHLGSLIDVISNIGQYEEPMLDDIEDSIDIKPWWETISIDWEDVPIFLLQMLASMVDPTWRSNWIWQGGIGPITPIGIAAKLLGPDPTGEEDRTENEIKKQCFDTLSAKINASKDILKKAADALAANKKPGGATEKFWPSLSFEEQRTLLDFHMHDIISKYGMSSMDWAQQNGDTIYIQNGYVLTGDKRIETVGIDTETTDYQDEVSTILNASSFNPGTYEGDYMLKRYPRKIQESYNIFSFVSEYLEGYCGVMMQNPELQQGIYLPGKEWPEMDLGLVELRNALARFLSGLKFNSYKYTLGVDKFNPWPVDFLYISQPQISEHAGKNIATPIQWGDPEYAGMNFGHYNAHPMVVEDKGPVKHGYPSLIHSSLSIADTHRSIWQGFEAQIYKEHIALKSLDDQLSIALVGIGATAGRPRAPLSPSDFSDDGKTQAFKGYRGGLGEFQVFHPDGFKKYSAYTQGSWINLPHLSPYYLAAYYFSKSPLIEAGANESLGKDNPAWKHSEGKGQFGKWKLTPPEEVTSSKKTWF